MEEAWKPVLGFPDYEVSDQGRVRSKTRQVHNYTKAGRVLSPRIVRYPSTGRPVAVFVQLGRGNVRRVHRLVLEAFVGPNPPDAEGCHNDGDPTNNNLANLRWDTRAANRDDMVRHGTRVPPPVHRGESHHNTRLTADDVRSIREPGYGRGLYTKLGKQYGVSGQTIRRIRDREVWRHV